MKFGGYKKVVLMGGGPLLRRISLWLINKSIPVLLITSSRRSKEKIEDLTFKDFCKVNSIECKIIDRLELIKLERIIPNPKETLFISIGAPWIFKGAILNFFCDNLFNLHGTRLPQNRGGGGFSWQIIMGSRYGMCCLHKVDKKIDTGPIVFFEEFIFKNSSRIPQDFIEEYAEKNFLFLIGIFKKYLKHSNNIQIKNQVEYLSTYWPRLSTDDNGWIDWDRDPHHIERFICAFDNPYNGASTLLNDKHVRLKKVCLSSQDGSFSEFQNGMIFRVSHDWVCVCLRNYTLIIQEILDKNGNKILSKLNVGDRFITPSSRLELSKKRLKVTSTGFKRN